MLVITSMVSIGVLAFDCKKEFLPVDFVICSSTQVMEANEDHENAWYATRARLNKVQKKELLDNQREWLKQYPPTCGIPSSGKPISVISIDSQQCVIKALIDRTNFLNNYSSVAHPGQVLEHKESIHLIDFRNYTYSSAGFGSEPVTLKNGKFIDHSNFGTHFNSVEYADFNNDGKDDAVVSIGTDIDGSAAYIADYFVYAYQQGQLKEIYHMQREKPQKDMMVVNNTIIITAPHWEPDDSHSSPSYLETTTYGWKNDAIKVISKHLVPYLDKGKDLFEEQPVDQEGIYWATTSDLISAGMARCKHFDTPNLEEQKNRLIKKYGKELKYAQVVSTKTSGKMFTATRFDKETFEDIDYVYFNTLSDCEAFQADILKNMQTADDGKSRITNIETHSDSVGIDQQSINIIKGKQVATDKKVVNYTPYKSPKNLEENNSLFNLDRGGAAFLIFGGGIILLAITKSVTKKTEIEESKQVQVLKQPVLKEKIEECKQVQVLKQPVLKENAPKPHHNPDFSCKKCGSDNIQRLKTIYDHGTFHGISSSQTLGEYGGQYGFSTTMSKSKTQSIFAKMASPPEKRNSFVWFLFSGMAGFGGNVWSLFFAILFFIIAIVNFFYNTSEWPDKYDSWACKWTCLRCGSIFYIEED